MKIDREQLQACPPDTAANLLYELGKDLRGTNLKKASWLLIANGLQVQRIADILLGRLQAATTRQDALRVLRIARKWVRTHKEGSKGANRQPSQENLLSVAAETSPEMYLEDENERRWDLWEEEEFGPRGYYEDWLAEQENADLSDRSRLPGLLPASLLQETIYRYAWEHQTYERYQPEDLRSHLNEETVHRLLALANQRTGLGLTEAEMAFIRQNRLDQILQYVEHPQQLFDPAPIRDGFSLAGLRIIEGYTGPKGHPFQVDWKAIERWLAKHLVRKPQQETISSITASAYAFFRDAPASLLIHLLQRSVKWHLGWTSLLGYAYQRASELLPNKAAVAAEPPGWWGYHGAYLNNIRWERVLDAGTGSHLVLHHLRKNAEDLFHQPVSIKKRYCNGVQKLLMAGGGTLRRMDYPAFTLVCRPSISMVRLETFTEMASLATKLDSWNTWIIYLNKSKLAAWIEGWYESSSSGPLPENLCNLIADTLEQHAVAYLMLKERVLRESFQAAPFRLRRKHIQRFWASQEAGEKIAFPIPTGLDALREEFGAEPMKEALVHALLDHFKDDWGLSEGPAHQLKETLLILLRTVAITYHLCAPWLPPHGTQPGEDDLEHTQEVANFLIQQTGHAPLEMAQTLLINPQQGLPLLAGGQMTTMERNCRRLIKEIAGVSQKKVSGGEARVFTCRPLTKIAALDRGSLGGDCSSDSVPMRALSPHHTYYGIFENGEQQRGYMTVYEAGAEVEDEEEKGEHLPVLCLETINVPLRGFDSAQQDLLVIFEAIAKSRGLAEGLVLITGLGTWNYQNGEVLRQSRRFRKGRPVRLFPADPASWNVYRILAPEAQHYTAFFDEAAALHHSGYFRLLSPFQPELDSIEPENRIEAQRIASLPPKRLRLTAHSENGPAGFISELPEIL